MQSESIKQSLMPSTPIEAIITRSCTEHTRWQVDNLGEILGNDVEPNMLFAELSKQVQSDFTALSNTHRAEEFFEAVKFPGTNVPDYFHKLILLDNDGLSVLAGIRFRTTDSECLPYIRIYSLNLACPCTDDIEAALLGFKSSVAPAFKVFSPRWIEVSVPATFSTINHSLIDTYLFGGKPTSLKADSFSSLPIELKEAEDLELSYAGYTNSYHAFHQRFPDLREQVPVDCRNDFFENAKERLSLDIMVDKVWAGFISVTFNQQFSSDTGRVSDIVIAPEFIGHGLGKASYAMLHQEFSKRSIKYTLAQIARENYPSQAISRAVGQKPILINCKVPL